MKRNDDALTEEEAKRLEHAFGDDEFCRLMAAYATEISDPKYKEEQEAYLAQLEGRNELPFGKALVWPSIGFVVKCMHRMKGGTGGDGGGEGGKLFLNIVYSDRVAGPVENESERVRSGGSSWSVPNALGPLRMERDKTGTNLVPTFDVCFHPLSLRYAHAYGGFRDLVIDIAKDAAANAFVASGDEADILDGYAILRGVSYKSGTPRALMIDLSRTIEPRAQSDEEITGASGACDGRIRVPKYKIVERRAFDIAEHAMTSDVPTTRRPSHLIVTIYLDRAMTSIKSADDINLDVRERELKIMPDTKCEYQLEVALPYRVDPKRGDASFDRKRRTLMVTLPVA